MIITEQEINKAYKELEKATSLYCQAAETAIYSKEDYEQTVASALAHGEIEGSNKEKREANAQEKFMAEFTTMKRDQTTERDAKLSYDLALLEVQRVRALLRLAEVEAGVQHVA